MSFNDDVNKLIDNNGSCMATISRRKSAWVLNYNNTHIIGGFEKAEDALLYIYESNIETYPIERSIQMVNAAEINIQAIEHEKIPLEIQIKNVQITH